MNDRIIELATALREEIKLIESPDEKIEALNEVRFLLHKVSPLQHHPVDCVLWKKSEGVEKNEYNPISFQKFKYLSGKYCSHLKR
jgi:hypothetical protein